MVSILDSARPSALDSVATNFPEFVAADYCPYCLSTIVEYAGFLSRYHFPSSYDWLAEVAPAVPASAYLAVTLAPSCC